jgi:hypothetical protein
MRTSDGAEQGFYDRTLANATRWQVYRCRALYTALETAGLVDPGTGATWQALEDCGLVRCRSVPDALGVPLLEVEITAKGRLAVSVYFTNLVQRACSYYCALARSRRGRHAGLFH